MGDADGSARAAAAGLVVWTAAVVIYRSCTLERITPREWTLSAAWAALGAALMCLGPGPLAPPAVAVLVVAGVLHVRQVNIAGPSALAADDTISLSGKVVVVTGVAVDGIGLHTALAFARQGATVVITCRSPKRGEEARQALLAELGTAATARISVQALDLARLESVRSCAAELLRKYSCVDILVNNAGLMTDQRQLTIDGHELTLQVNCLAPFLLTVLLAPALAKSTVPARVVFVSSSVHKAAASLGGLDFGNLNLSQGFGMFRAYAQSKLAALILAKGLARAFTAGAIRASPDGPPLKSRAAPVAVNSLMPGTISTGISRDMPWWAKLGHKYAVAAFVKSREQGARTTVFVAAARSLDGVTGEYFEHCQLAPAAKQASDPKLAAQVWSWAVQAVGVKPLVASF